MVNTLAESDEPWTEKPPRLDVGVVGTGRAGSVIGAALKRAGHQVKACTAVTDLSKLRAEALLPGVAILSIEETVADRDLILLSIPDDVLAQVVSGLAATNAVSPGTFVLHLSGRYGIEVLRPLTELGCSATCATSCYDFHRNQHRFKSLVCLPVRSHNPPDFCVQSQKL